MNTQSPTTEAGRALLEEANTIGPVGADGSMRWGADWPARTFTAEAILAIEEAARAEGRREAVREIRDHNDFDKCPVWLRMHIDNVADRVAALNASESPPTCSDCGAPLVNEGGVWTDRTYGSGDYCPEARLIGPDGTGPHKPVGDASESVQPPESHDNE